MFGYIVRTECFVAKNQIVVEHIGLTTSCCSGSEPALLPKHFDVPLVFAVFV